MLDTLTTLLRSATHVLAQDPRLTMRSLQLFLLVAQRQGKNGVLVADLVKATGLNQSSIARALSFMSEQPRRDLKEPLRWLEQVPDPSDPRRGLIKLTAKGEQLLSDLENF